MVGGTSDVEGGGGATVVVGSSLAGGADVGGADVGGADEGCNDNDDDGWIMDDGRSISDVGMIEEFWSVVDVSSFVVAVLTSFTLEVGSP